MLDADFITTTIAANVRAALARLGRAERRQAAVAAYLGRPQSTISRYVRGAAPWPMVDVARIAAYTRTPLQDLVAGVYEPPGARP